MIRHVTSLGRLSVLPLVFAALVLMQLYSDSRAGIEAVTLWGVTAAAGIAIGMSIARNDDMSIDREENSITLPGSPLTLILVLTNFVWKYWMDFILDARASTELTNIDRIYVLAAAAMSGAITGIFAGRFI